MKPRVPAFDRALLVHTVPDCATSTDRQILPLRNRSAPAVAKLVRSGRESLVEIAQNSGLIAEKIKGLRWDSHRAQFAIAG